MEKPISDKIQAKLLELRLKYPTPSPEEEERQLHGGYIREAMAEKNIAASRQKRGPNETEGCIKTSHLQSQAMTAKPVVRIRGSAEL